MGGTGGRGQNGTVTLIGSGLTTLSADRTVYEVGQSAVYTVSGKPNRPILWSSWKDGMSTGEVDANYGQVTDAAGNWTGTLGAWQPGDLSSNYEKQAKVDGRTAKIRLEIVPVGSLTRWAGWNSLQGLTVNERMGVAQSEGLDWYVFARATDNSVRYNRYQCWAMGECGFSGWQSLDGAVTSRPVAATRGVGSGGHVDVFARGVDGSIYYRHRPPWQGTFESWVSLGGYIVGAPAVVAVNNRLMVFARGGDNALYVNTFDGTNWSGYAGLGGHLTGDPVAVVRGGVVDVFGRNVGGDIVSRRWDGSSWADWYSLGGWLDGNIDAVATKTDNIFVFARAGQTAWVNHLDGGWSGWQSLGEAVVGDPSAVAAPYNAPYAKVWVSFRGTNDQLHAKGWSSTSRTWTAWHSSGGGSTTTPALVSYQHLMMASDKDTGTVYWRRFEPPAEYSAPPTPPPSPACGYTWRAHTVFAPDEHYTGCNGRLHMQLDGNLVIYSPSGVPLWATGTVGHNYARASFEDSGELVVRSESGQQLWASGTFYTAGSGRLEFQGDGNLVIYTAAGIPIWATGTFGDP